VRSPLAADGAAAFSTDVYRELHAVAGRYLSRERVDHTLQPTALVNEAYARLLKRDGGQDLDRQRFVFAAARAMRCILVDHARRRNARKRGGANRAVPLEPAVMLYEQAEVDLIELNDALERLAALDAQASEIVELRFFGGMTIEEIATALGVSTRTVERGWRFARMWLFRELDPRG
jgi:RNA polymerase sigma factor (TIGR02999 family)